MRRTENKDVGLRARRHNIKTEQTILMHSVITPATTPKFQDARKAGIMERRLPLKGKSTSLQTLGRLLGKIVDRHHGRESRPACFYLLVVSDASLFPFLLLSVVISRREH